MLGYFFMYLAIHWQCWWQQELLSSILPSLVLSCRLQKFQIVSTQGIHSDQIELCCDAPHGFVLGPILFILDTQPLTSVILKHPVSHMLYADDTQLYKSFDLDDCLPSILCVEKCVSVVSFFATRTQISTGIWLLQVSFKNSSVFSQLMN